MQMQVFPIDGSVLARRAKIVAAMRGILPFESVIDQETGRRPYETDSLTAYRAQPCSGPGATAAPSRQDQ
jgi:hypothetical protein